MRVETHMHCSPASPCAFDSPRTMLAAASRFGIDAVFLTDHDTLESWDSLDPSDIPEGLVACPGVECTVGAGRGYDGDVLVLADGADVLRGLDTGGRSLVSAQDLADRLSGFPRERYFVSWAHPLGNLEAGGRLSARGRFLLSFADAVEGYNGNHGDMGSLSPAIFAEADRLGTRRTAGSDAHAARDVGRAVTLVPGTASDAAGLIRLMHAAGAFGREVRQRPSADYGYTDLDIRFE